jgi:hypothetical protein
VLDEQLIRNWMGALAPSPKVAPSWFAEREIILPSSANAIPGPLRLAPYQRGLVEAIADEEAEIIVFRLSSQPSTAHLVCEERGVVITEAQRRAVIEGGSWEPTATGEPGIRSYHLNELASKFSSLESVARQAEHAKTPQQKQVSTTPRLPGCTTRALR